MISPPPGNLQCPIAACSGVHVAARSGGGAAAGAGWATGIWQCPIAACSDVQGTASGAGTGVAMVQCPIAACSAVQDGGGSEGCVAAAASVQWPGHHVHRVLERLAGTLAVDDLEEMAVQMHRVGHHRVVGEPETRAHCWRSGMAQGSRSAARRPSTT